MSRWFRFYDDAVNDPKVQRLPGDLFKCWVNLLCLASKHNGVLPAFEDIAFSLRLPDAEVVSCLDDLVARGLLDHDDNGLRPHNWNGRQHASDRDPTNAERQKRYRENHPKPHNALRNEPVTALDTDTDTEKKEKPSVSCVVDAKASTPTTHPEQFFARFWQAYPKRQGTNPKHPAKTKFIAALKNGADPEQIISGAARYAEECRSTGKFGTEFVKQALPWLNQRLWEDYAADPPQDVPPVFQPPPGAPTTEEILKRLEAREQRQRERLLRESGSPPEQPQAGQLPGSPGPVDGDGEGPGVPGVARILRPAFGLAPKVDGRGEPRREPDGDIAHAVASMARHGFL